MTGEEIETVEGEDAGTPSHRLLQAFIARAERLAAEIADLQADRRDVLAEAKAAGFDPPALREVLRRRKIEPLALADLDSLVAVYEEAARGMPRGMVWGGDLRPAPHKALPAAKE
jgi:uncharacterized protein (UPF0335 family)